MLVPAWSSVCLLYHSASAEETLHRRFAEREQSQKFVWANFSVTISFTLAKGSRCKLQYGTDKHVKTRFYLDKLESGSLELDLGNQGGQFCRYNIYPTLEITSIMLSPATVRSNYFRLCWQFSSVAQDIEVVMLKVSFSKQTTFGGNLVARVSLLPASWERGWFRGATTGFPAKRRLSIFFAQPRSQGREEERPWEQSWFSRGNQWWHGTAKRGLFTQANWNLSGTLL